MDQLQIMLDKQCEKIQYAIDRTYTCVYILLIYIFKSSNLFTLLTFCGIVIYFENTGLRLSEMSVLYSC